MRKYFIATLSFMFCPIRPRLWECIEEGLEMNTRRADLLFVPSVSQAGISILPETLKSDGVFA